MKIKLLFLSAFVALLWIAYAGFSPNDDSPKWSSSPSTRVDINPEGVYTELPAGDNGNFSNETRYYSTPQGVFAVGPNFRVHPTTSRTQSETPIVRHPLNPNIMFGSANTFNVGGTTTFSCGHYATTDGGLSWFGDDTTVFNFGDPGPMIDYTGRFLISYITSTGQIGASYSVNNGASWSGVVTLPGSTSGADKNLSTTDNTPTSSYYGRAYTVYSELNDGRIWFSYSSNGGVSWTTVIPISPTPSAGHHHQGCDLTVDIFGWIRVVWANCTTNGQNSTEDYLGWAESGNGGITWQDQSNTKVNTNGIRTSDLLPPSSEVLRGNGFPRIDGDKTCNPSDGDEYVVMAEKNFAPALDNADIVLMRTTDGGTTWTRTRVNQNAAGSYEFSPAVHVDETGAVNVCYYSTRGIPTNDSARIYLSRSTDGGVTFTDVLVSDHKFKPAHIAGTAAGYWGDYIGITSGGAGKIVPYWCEQNTSTGGRSQAYAALVDVSQTTPCEDFSCIKDAGSSTLPLFTRDFYEEFSGTNYWTRQTPTAYNIGTGSARFNSWSASAGTKQSLVSYNFANAVANTYLTFDEAYSPWSGGNVDSLIVESSVNGGTTWTVRARLWGGLGAQAGPLNTEFIGGGELIPTGGQWRPKIYLLPLNTNKVRLRAVSGFGNDIWVDNVCVSVQPTPISNSIGVAVEGMFNCSFPYPKCADSIRVYLHRADFPNVIVDSAIGTMNTSAIWNGTFGLALSGNYYKVLDHRNSIRTWTNSGLTYTRGGNAHFNMITPSGQAYGNNQKHVCSPTNYWAMFSGDVNKDGSINGLDLARIDNDVFNFVTGYVKTDLNCDGQVDALDAALADNNATNFVSEVAPPGAEPTPPPSIEDNSKNITFENDALRQKYLLTLKLLKEQETQTAQNIEKKKSSIEQKENRRTISDNRKAINPSIEEKKMLEENNNIKPSGRIPGEE